MFSNVTLRFWIQFVKVFPEFVKSKNSAHLTRYVKCILQLYWQYKNKSFFFKYNRSWVFLTKHVLNDVWYKIILGVKFHYARHA